MLDSLKQTPDYAPAAAADIRVLLTHIGTEMQTDDEGNARPVWVDADVPHLQAVAEPTVQAWITSHTHESQHAVSEMDVFLRGVDEVSKPMNATLTLLPAPTGISLTENGAANGAGFPAASR